MSSKKKLTYPNLHLLNKQLLVQDLKEQALSDYTLEKILTPMQKMDIKGKEQYAKKLLSILKKSKSETEIIEKASTLIGSMNILR